jgi:Tfp pilus assembly protein PilF
VIAVAIDRKRAIWGQGLSWRINMRLHLVVGLMFLFPGTVIAQWAGNRSVGAVPYSPSPINLDSVVRGQISSDRPLVGSLTVELTMLSSSGSMSAPLEAGTFEFHGVAPGSYQLRVTGAGGVIVHEESVLITGAYQNLLVQVPNKPTAGKSTEATVSIRQLQHKVPGEAQKEFDKGQSASTKGNEPNALEHFHKAVAIDPGFAEAFNGLGATYAALGQLEQAADQFQKAIDLVPDHPLALANLSIVLCKLEHYHEASQVARRALKFNPTVMKIHYVLGVALAAEGVDKAEALDNFERAASEIPKAHLLAARILIESDRRDDAVKQVEEYLRSSPGDAVDRQKVRAWLDQLRK